MSTRALIRLGWWSIALFAVLMAQFPNAIWLANAMSIWALLMSQLGTIVAARAEQQVEDQTRKQTKALVRKIEKARPSQGHSAQNPAHLSREQDK